MHISPAALVYNKRVACDCELGLNIFNFIKSFQIDCVSFQTSDLHEAFMQQIENKRALP